MSAKRWLRLTGLAFALAAGGYFVVHAHHALVGHDLSALLNANVLISGALLTVLYAAAIPVTALAWLWILRMLGQQTSYAHLAPVLAVTQFGKYLPGNVAQHIGRVVLAQSPGVRLPAVVFSIVYETLLSIVACVHISALTFLWAMPAELAHWKVVEYRWPLLVAVSLGAIAVLLAVPRVASRVAKHRSKKNGMPLSDTPHFNLRWKVITASYGLYVVNIVLTGVGLWLVARSLPGASYNGPSILFMTGAFASTWIFGFLAPGAPAGLGVREGVLSAWLITAMPASPAIILILILRIATTLGDLLNFSWGSLVMAKKKRTCEPLRAEAQSPRQSRDERRSQ